MISTTINKTTETHVSSHPNITAGRVIRIFVDVNRAYSYGFRSPFSGKLFHVGGSRTEVYGSVFFSLIVERQALLNAHGLATRLVWCYTHLT